VPWHGLTPEQDLSEKANRIRMILQDARYSKIVMVEGSKDKEVYSRVLDVAPEAIVPVCSKETLVSLRQRLADLAIGGLADADFDRLLGVVKVDLVYFTDTHDLETLILELAPNLFSDLVAAAISKPLDLASSGQLHSAVTQDCLVFAGLRFLNARHRLGISFKDFFAARRLSEVFDYTPIHLNFERTISVLCRRPQRIVAEGKTLLQLLEGLRSRFSDPGFKSQAIHGHDFFEFLAFRLENQFGVMRDAQWLERWVRRSPRAAEVARSRMILELVSGPLGVKVRAVPIPP
jgi:hypothetical protein